MDWDEVEVHKNAKRQQGQYPAILTELAWAIKDFLHGIPRLHVTLCFYFCGCRFQHLSALCFHSRWRSWFSRFLVPSRQRNHGKSFYCHGKYFSKENFRAPIWTSAKFYCRNKTGNPERTVSPHLTRFSSQSQRGIWFIFPAHGASHMIDVHILLYFPEVTQHFIKLNAKQTNA